MSFECWIERTGIAPRSSEFRHFSLVSQLAVYFLLFWFAIAYTCPVCWENIVLENASFSPMEHDVLIFVLLDIESRIEGRWKKRVR